MGKVRRSLHLRHLQGKIGDLVYKWYGDRLVVTRAPRSPAGPGTVKQRGGRGRFGKASRYADKARKDPAVWALYAPIAKKLKIPARALAIQDYLVKPQLQDIDLRPWDGRAGGIIAILLADKHPFKTTAVTLALHGADGKLIERGPAQSDGKRAFNYETRTAIRPGTALTIRVEATDRFGKTDAGTWSGRPGIRHAVRTE